MTPIEFTLWLNGAAGILGDQPPTQEQWVAIQEKLGEAVGAIVASRLLETASEVQREKQQRSATETEFLRLQSELARQRHEMALKLGGLSGRAAFNVAADSKAVGTLLDPSLRAKNTG